MDKIRTGEDAFVSHALIQVKVDEIIDWINAHGETKDEFFNKQPFDVDGLYKPSIEQEPVSQICRSCTNYKCRDELDGKVTVYTCPNFQPSIEQELESGLENLKDPAFLGAPCNERGKPCTRIFLPAAKYEELVRVKGKKVLVKGKAPMASFHDIPVFSYSGEEIVYCTD